MKKITILLVTILVSITLNAQEYSKSLDGIEWVKIESKAPIIIKTQSKKELTIKGGSALQIPEKAKGLKLVGEGGSDNTNVGYYVFKEGNSLIVRNLLKSDNGKTTLYLPASQKIKVISDGLNDMEIEGFTNEIEASSEITGSITLRNISGPITVNSNTGNVEVIFNKVNQSSPISISTATGTVDVSLPEDTPAELFLESTMGEIYTNFNLSIPDKKGLKAISSQNVKGVINNGGVKIQLNSATGNIYLRKK
tara:strand:+ start:5688 stop:6443 length:756 start_codon:yes stop_codon:yes gene_type:complete